MSKNNFKEDKLEVLKKRELILPVMFCALIIITGFINISNFQINYKELNDNEAYTLKTKLSLIESKYAEDFVGKNNYININGAFARFTDKKELNEVVRLDNNHLTVLTQENNTYVDNSAKAIIELSKHIEGKEIPFVYIQAPNKQIDDVDNMPEGFATYANKNINSFLEELESNNVEMLNLIEKLQNEEFNHYDLFYRTDHHWNPYGAFWGSNEVISKFNEILNLEIENEEAMDINNYNIEIIEDSFLGSRGKRVGPSFAGLDDSIIITPNFETDLTLNIPEMNIVNKRGAFEDTLLFKERIENRNLDKFDPYHLHLGGNYEFIKIENNNSTNDKKVFIIKDSFALPLATFLSLNYSEVYLYDLRSGSSEEMLSKIDEINPDIVSVLYNPSVLGNSELYGF